VLAGNLPEFLPLDKKARDETIAEAAADAEKSHFLLQIFI
jgi:hypothetical protein